MSIKSKIFAAAATLTMVGGIGAAGTLTAGAASAATPSCGHNCIDIFSQQFGTHKHPTFVLDVFQAEGQGRAAHHPVARPATPTRAKTSPSPFQGTVNDFFKAGLVTASLNLHYSKLVGVRDRVLARRRGQRPVRRRRHHRRQRHPGGPRAVRPVRQDRVGGGLLRHSIKGHFVPLINGSDTNFSHPYVLNYPGNGAYPTDKPRPQLTTWTLSKYSNGTVFNNQMWSANFGVLP